MIIAVDYDDTLKDRRTGRINLGLVGWLRGRQCYGDKVILWTCRSGTQLTEAVKELRAVGFIPDTVNDNVPEMIKRFNNNPRKVYADIYIDDKARIPPIMGA